MERWGISWLFFLVSVGVFLFIFGGVIKGSFNKLLNETYFFIQNMLVILIFAPQQTKKQRKDLWEILSVQLLHPFIGP